mgnify:CR=1 FL=1
MQINVALVFPTPVGMNRRLAINAVTNRVKETAEYDEKGIRICLDCGIEVIKVRIESVGAVRCVTCQGEADSINRIYR